MKVKCIDNSNGWEWRLTIDKIYNVIEEKHYRYWIINDDGYKNWYPKDRFKSLSEIRNETINKLLEDES